MRITASLLIVLIYSVAIFAYKNKNIATTPNAEIETCDKPIRYSNPDNNFSLTLPTAFTPNGDGKNDFYRIVGTGLSNDNFSITVSKENGDIVFTTKNYNTAWDGNNINSKPLTEYKFRVTAHFSTPAGVVDTCTIVYKLESGTYCVKAVAADSSNYIFEDQLEITTGAANYATGENFCD